MNEIWRDIENFEGLYQVSNLGNVRSVDRVLKQRNRFSECNHFYRGIVLKAKKSACGYYRVVLSKDYKSYNKSVHKLVAEAFITNPNNYPCVNHIDGNKENNNANNLEWCTYGHNNREARRMGLNKGYKGLTWKKRCQLAIEYMKPRFMNCIDNEKRYFADYDIQEIYEILKGNK